MKNLIIFGIPVVMVIFLAFFTVFFSPADRDIDLDSSNYSNLPSKATNVENIGNNWYTFKLDAGGKKESFSIIEIIGTNLRRWWS